MQDKLLLVAQSILASMLIYISWGHDEPIYNFALCFGGVLLGHVLTLVLDDTGEGEGE